MSTAPDDAVLVRDRHDAVTVLRLNRPEARNALSPQLMHDVGAAILESENDDTVRAVVLTGTGDAAFCAGMDLAAFSRGERMTLDDAAGDAFMRLMRGESALPIIGAANASAVAGGLELLLGCDVVVAAEGASFGLPEVKRGLIPGGGGAFLAARIPLAVALELNLTGDSITAERAAALGLVNVVVPTTEVLSTAIALATRIAGNGPLAVTALKELVRLAAFDSPAAVRRFEELRTTVFGSEDAKEGALAFVEKRDPVWRGR